MKGSGDVEYRSKAMAAHRAIGRLFASRGDMSAALDHARTASRLADELIRIEPANTQWLEFGAGAQLELGQLLTLYGQPAAAGAAIRSGCDICRAADRQGPQRGGVERPPAARLPDRAGAAGAGQRRCRARPSGLARRRWRRSTPRRCGAIRTSNMRRRWRGG